MGGREHGFPYYAPSAAATLVSALVEQGELNEAEDVLRWHGRLNELAAWREPFPRMPVAA